MLGRIGIAALLLLFFMIHGCGQSYDLSAGSETIQTGDPEDRVRELCGEPHRTVASAVGEEWHYETILTDESGQQGKLKLRVIIDNGKVVAVSRSTGPAN